MQPLTLFRERLPLLAQPAGPEPSLDPTTTRIWERPESTLARGSYAWPAWAVWGLAAVAIIGGLVWWLRLQRRGARKANGPRRVSP